MIILNGSAGSKGRMAYSCTYFLCFCFYDAVQPELGPSHSTELMEKNPPASRMILDYGLH